jgi:cytoskeletal protein CcmA (bactofilin family)
MTQKTKQILKSYFETGNIPTQGNYVNLIDSLAVLQNDHNSGSLTLSGSLYISGSSYIDGNITASGNISASGYLVIQNITASSNISASGYLVAQNITASKT